MANKKILSRETVRALTGVAMDMAGLARQCHVFLTASSLAYTTILSIIPVLAVSFAVFHAFGGMEKLLGTFEPFILSNLAHGTGEEVSQALHRFIGNARATAIGVGGLIGLIVTTMTMFASVENAINELWGANQKRGLFQRIAFYWLFVTLGPMALAIAVGLATSSDMPLTQFLPSGSGILILSVGLLFCIYQFVPNCRVDWRCSLISAAITAALWDLARLGYTVYTKKAVSYNKIYGSLGAIPVLLVWIYIMWLIVLSGAVLTVALQRRLEPLDKRLI